MSASTLLQSLFRYKAWANDELFAELAKFDADIHTTERHTAIRLMNHIYVVDRIFAGHLSGGAHGYSATNTTETPTLGVLREAVVETDRWYMHYVSTIEPQQLSQTLNFVFTDGANGRMSREEMLLHVSTHGAYHRGAVGSILTQVALPAPRDLLTRYLHSSEPERRLHV